MNGILIKMQRFRIAYTSDTICLYIKKFKKESFFENKSAK